ncbi:hypothetical protein INT47_007471 [Mucor saturninus]|uniref:Integrase catalytic domain-containing protein n=1 Tax=Mucor saturninus TaxID=64648 RepID=A0A8H7QGE7_9FUNG|nr:hypothetical protein INT47_007471 [Mucor saturninus]
MTSVNLRINFDKSAFLQTSIYLLGFIVGPGIKKIDTRRLCNIDDWKTPRNSRDVRHIMGIVSHLREFVPLMGRISYSINALRNCSDKNKPFVWGPQQDEALKSLKTWLTSSTILHTIDMNKRIYIETDASHYAYGILISQRDEIGRSLYITFASKTFSKHEMAWSVNRKETYAIVYAFQKYRSILWGHPDIVVLTDHRSLVFMNTATHLCRTLQNYMDVLSEFKYRVEYIPGFSNTFPDMLSRLYPPEVEDQILREDEEKKIEKLEKMILQRRLPKDKINQKITKDKIVYKTKVYSKDENLNVLATRLNSKEHKEMTTEYIAPPVEDRKKLLSDTHLKGHFGSESMVQQLHAQGIHWNGIFKDSKEYIKTCIDCARNNVVRKGYHPLRPVVSADPFSFLALDLAGPFSVTENSNMYILVIVDLCTKYIIARPLKNKQSDTVTKEIMHVLGDYGIPLNLKCVSDNGRDFVVFGYDSLKNK